MCYAAGTNVVGLSVDGKEELDEQNGKTTSIPFNYQSTFRVGVLKTDSFYCNLAMLNLIKLD